jgi:hypothetical protein
MTAPLAFEVILRADEPVLSARDREAIEQLVSWRRTPAFAKPGRTAWHVLQDPVRAPGGGPMLRAAKLKGVGAWNPADAGAGLDGAGSHPTGLVRPSVAEFAKTARTAHFGVDAHGRFQDVHSEPAPFGAILLRRARQEYENARRLADAGVRSVVPGLLARYEGPGFHGEPLGAVVCLSPTASPQALDFLYQRDPDPTPERRAHAHAVLEALGLPGEHSVATFVRAQALVAFRVGRALRRFAQAGLYRHSSAWDNFYFDPRTGDVCFTDLDSSRCLAELPAPVAGLQVLRDLAGALWRLPKQLCEAEVLGEFPLEAVLAEDALAATLAGFLEIGLDEARRHVAPLWDHVVPGWFLMKRHGPAVASWSKAERKSHRIDRGIFCCLAILAVAEPYAARHEALGLPAAPSIAALRAAVRDHVGEQADYLDWLLARAGATA